MLDVDLMALAMAVTDAGSFSGGECAQRCSGFMFSKDAGVPRLCGMSMGFAQLRTPGDVDRWLTAFLFLRRVLASQFVICVLLSPVCFWSISFSSSFG
jgi:hypothetical protein